MNDIVKYTTFKSSPEFEKWQKENAIRVVNITPLAAGFNAEEMADENIEASITYSVFVTYMENS